MKTTAFALSIFPLIACFACGGADSEDAAASEAAQTGTSEFAWATCNSRGERFGLRGSVSLLAAPDANGKLAVVGIKGVIIENPFTPVITSATFNVKIARSTNEDDGDDAHLVVRSPGGARQTINVERVVDSPEFGQSSNAVAQFSYARLSRPERNDSFLTIGYTLNGREGTVTAQDCSYTNASLLENLPTTATSPRATTTEAQAIETKYREVLADPNLAAFCVTKLGSDFVPALRINRKGNPGGSLGQLVGPSFHHEPHVTGDVFLTLSGAETDEGIVVHELRNGKLVQVSGRDDLPEVSVVKVRFESLGDDAASRELRDRVQLVTSDGDMKFDRCRLGPGRF